LEEILTENDAYQAIQEQDPILKPHDIARYAQQVCQVPSSSQPESQLTKLYRKIFRVLALIEREADIALIINDDKSEIFDADLPLQAIAIEGGKKAPKSSSPDNRSY